MNTFIRPSRQPADKQKDRYIQLHQLPIQH